MSNAPTPDQTPEGPAYEGRLLDRPDDDVVDQGAAFDMTTLVTRRRVLGLVGVGAGTMALAACSASGSGSSGSSSSQASSAATSEGEIPQETNGPYPADGTTELNVLEDSGIVRRDITSSLDGGSTVEGVPLTFTFTVNDMVEDAPFEGAALYAWQCDAQGQYSMYTSGVEDETWLRGIQVADENGELTFETIVPGCYAGRWPHIHFEVYPDADSASSVENAIATSQLAFPTTMLAEVYALDAYAGSSDNLSAVGTEISDDGIFGDGDWELQVPTISGDPDSGYLASLTVNIDTSTEPGSVEMGGGPGGEGGQPPGGEGGEPPSGEPPAGDPPNGAPGQDD